MADAENTPLRLASLAGDVVPDDILQQAPRLNRLTDRSVSELGPILSACVLEPMKPELAEQLSRYCLVHEIAEADLGHVVKVCRWLLREASAMNLTEEELLADIERLWPGSVPISNLLQELYPPVRERIRQELLVSALLKHGHVLADVDWRVDYISSERHAPRIDTPIAMVTLRYQTGQGDERLTLQMTAPHLQRLAQVFAGLAQRVTHSPAAPDKGLT